jgi:hypothetical protein
MLTVERIREMCARVVTAEGDAFEAAIVELAKAVDLFEPGKEKNGDKSADAD